MSKTIHTSRTMMFAELVKLMDFATQDNSYLDSLNQNVINKKTKSGVEKTTRYLISLYGFDLNNVSFRAFQYFWGIVEENEKPLLALLFAIGNDYLLEESISVVAETKLNDKVTIERMEENIEIRYPNRYSENTRRSMAQNIASSWKQAGFITGKVKNIRTQPNIGFHVAAFAFFLAFLSGDRGEFILSSKYVKALMLSQSRMRELAIKASKRDLIQYQFGGNVTSFAFTNLISKLEINDI